LTTNTAKSVTEQHMLIIKELSLEGNPEVLLHRRIPGFGDNDDNARLSTGIHLATMGEDLGRTFSSRQDIRFGTAVVLSEGTSTTAEDGQRLIGWRRAIIDAVHQRRATRLSCELFTQVRNLSLEMKPSKARDQDYVGLEIWSYFRESR
jgi:hypothetical protein